MSSKSWSLRAFFARRARVFVRSRRGSIAPMVVLLIVPLVGLLGVATEGGTWFAIQRAEQNAADAAVIAAATNGGNGGTNYVTEGRAVASNYGFANGSNNTTVTIPVPADYSSVTSCASSPCYAVQITHKTPLLLLEILGFAGNTTVGSSKAQSITATALATTKTIDSGFCLTAVGTGGKKGDAISANGVPKSTIDCNIQSEGNANCNGNNGLTSGWSDAAGGTNNCGTLQNSVSTSSVTNSVSYGSISAPTSTCPSTGSFPTVPTKKSGTPLPASNQWTSQSLPTTDICGDYQLQNDVTLTTGGTLVIENGSLDLNGHTLSTSGTGTGLTIILTTGMGGTSTNPSVIEDTAGGGTLNISSPTGTGTWDGIVIWQNPNLSPQSMSFGGNSPTFDISGVVYLPVTALSANGAVNKSTNGYNCFVLVVNTILVSGTGDLFYSNPLSQCNQQGVTPPTNAAYVIGELVY